jgi:hypothetical protein
MKPIEYLADSLSGKHHEPADYGLTLRQAGGVMDAYHYGWRFAATAVDDVAGGWMMVMLKTGDLRLPFACLLRAFCMGFADRRENAE